MGQGPAEAGEGEAGGECDAEQADQGLHRDQAVRGRAGRAELTVADGGQRLHAEEEGLQEPLPRGEGRGAVEGSGTAQQVADREQEVQQGVGAEQRGIERPQRRVQHRVVEAQRPQEGQVLARDVEAAVAIQEPGPGLLEDLAAEAEVPFLRRQHLEGSGGQDRPPPCS